jgi:outer membrane lipoprotein-sorting protein
MKKLLCLLTGVILFASVGAQSLEEIVKKHAAAVKADQLSKIKTVRITGKMTMMGMEMPLEMYMKNPNKIKVIYTVAGKQMISVFDGEKGYVSNPLTGSTEPVELTGEQLNQLTRNNVFTNEVINNYNKKKLTYEREEMVKGKPAYRLRVDLDGGAPAYLFIDKESGLLTKISATVEQMGTTMNVDTFFSDYTNKNGLVIPTKTTATTNGIEAAVITFDNIEVNIPIDDSMFKIK